MLIRFYEDKDQSEVIKLVLGIQNDEYNVGLNLDDQPDLRCINSYFRDKGGAFWVAENNGRIVGCIGLVRLSQKVGALKKFFVVSEFRGKDKGVASSLFDTLLLFAQDSEFQSIILDTPAVAKRSHAFYERVGFQRIERKHIPVKYEYPDRNSFLFILEL